MKSRSAKNKGQRLTKEVRELLLAHLGLNNDDVNVVPSGVKGEDLWLSPVARGRFPLSVECKNQESLNIWAALDQATGHHLDYPGVVFFKRNRSPIFVACEAEVFLAFVAKACSAGADGEKEIVLNSEVGSETNPKLGETKIA
jgi:hypothetical protein